MAERVYDEREMFETFRLKRKLTDAELDAPPKNMSYSNEGQMVLLSQRQWFAQRTALYKACDICGEPICVNNWEDRKTRTPRFKGFVVCTNCDPRAVPDRYMKEGYRVIWPGRLRVIRYAQVTRAMSIHGCLNKVGPEGEEWTEPTCKCAGCAARKLMGT